jgi:prepilin signal peptidase PulO-like enzyme (type II secretory pathway)
MASLVWSLDPDMEEIIFFLAAIPAALCAERLIARFTDPYADSEEDSPAVLLPWQRGPWPARVRWGVVLPLPALMAIAGWRFDAPQAAAVSVLVLALLICTATDLLKYRVPNAVTYPGIVLALAADVFMPDGEIMEAVLAALLGGGLFLVLSILTRGGIGLGDVKLAVLIGAGLGLPGAYQALFLGIIVGGLVIAVLFLAGVVGRRQAVPYAPFLALAAVGVVLAQGAAFAPL